MADIVDPATRSRMMSRIRGKNTKPEMVVRRLLYSMGYRYRLHAADLPGKPDIVFRGRRIAVFVHGCFWHQHQEPSCRLAVLPKSNEQFWHEKLTKNRERDARSCSQLQALGWEVLEVWECELRDLDILASHLRSQLDKAGE